MKHADPDVTQASAVALLDRPTSLLDGPAIALGQVAQAQGLATGVVAAVTPDGIAMVILPGESSPRPCASILQFVSEAVARDALVGQTVVLSMRSGASPIILGVVAERLFPVASPGSTEATVQLPEGSVAKVEADKRVLNLEAHDEIRLTCGKSSLVLRRDGTVVVRGVNVTSRATQANKVRGATISLN